MRCPKCHYISFGSADRCRNCGYEFLLAVESRRRSICRSRAASRRVVRWRISSWLSGPRSSCRRTPVFARIADRWRGRRRACRSGQRRVRASICRSSGGTAVRQVTTRRSSRRRRFRARRCRCGGASPRWRARGPTARCRPMMPEPELAVRIVRVRDARATETAFPRDGPLEAPTPDRPGACVGRSPASSPGSSTSSCSPRSMPRSCIHAARRRTAARGDSRRCQPCRSGCFCCCSTAATSPSSRPLEARPSARCSPASRSWPTASRGSRRRRLEGWRDARRGGAARQRPISSRCCPPGLGFAAILFDSDGRALHDRLAETRVVKA